jgi:hypothetical protein
MNAFLKETIKSICNIVDNTECRDLKVGLSNLIECNSEHGDEHIRNKCSNMIECHEECISPEQFKTARTLLKISKDVDGPKFYSQLKVVLATPISTGL